MPSNDCLLRLRTRRFKGPQGGLGQRVRAKRGPMTGSAPYPTLCPAKIQAVGYAPEPAPRRREAPIRVALTHPTALGPRFRGDERRGGYPLP